MSLGGLSLAVPLIMGTVVSPTDGLPVWVTLLMAALSTGCTTGFYFAGKALTYGVAGYFRGRAKAKEKKAKELLADNDKSNDVQAEKLLVDAESEKGVAEALEKSAAGIKG